MAVLELALVSIGCTSVGAACGWFLRGGGSATSEKSPRDQALTGPVAHDEQSSAPKPQNAEPTTPRQTKALLEQVQQLTKNVNRQVGEHNLRIRHINETLTSGPSDSDAVLGAIEGLAEANAWMRQQLEAAERRMANQARLIESHIAEARTDALTNISNRRAFDEEWKHCVSEFQVDRKPAAVMLIDVDHFKKFNDQHGHAAGDEVLKHVGRAIKVAAPAGANAYRYGGEEFVVLFPGQTAEQSVAQAEKIRASIGLAAVECDGKSLQVAASAGLSDLKVGDNSQGPVERADEALYDAKKAGRNQGFWNNGLRKLPFVDELAAQAVAEREQAAKTQPKAQSDSEREKHIYETLGGLLYKREVLLDGLTAIVIRLENGSHICQKFGQQARGAIDEAVQRAAGLAIREGDLVLPLNESSYVVLLPGLGLASGLEIAERIKCSFTLAPVRVGDKATIMKASIGLTHRQEGDDASRLVQRAVAATNMAINSGGNAIAQHDGLRIQLAEEVLASC